MLVVKLKKNSSQQSNGFLYKLNVKHVSFQDHCNSKKNNKKNSFAKLRNDPWSINISEKTGNYDLVQETQTHAHKNRNKEMFGVHFAATFIVSTNVDCVTTFNKNHWYWIISFLEWFGLQTQWNLCFFKNVNTLTECSCTKFIQYVMCIVRYQTSIRLTS